MNSVTFGNFVAVFTITGIIAAATTFNIVVSASKKRFPVVIEIAIFIASLISVGCLVVIAPGLSEVFNEASSGGTHVHAALLSATIVVAMLTFGDIFVIIYFLICWKYGIKIEEL